MPTLAVVLWRGGLKRSWTWMRRYPNRKKIWAARVLIGTVLFLNLQCALAFLIWPGAYAPVFELAGTLGEAALRGMGILFVMWNIPYLMAGLYPLENKVSLVESAAMQAVGAGGETLVAFFLPQGHAVLLGSIQRFIVFDLAGLMGLLIALWLVRRQAGSAEPQVCEKPVL